MKFQSARPRGRTRHGFIKSKSGHSCFNPRVLAGGRDHSYHRLKMALEVSIRASSREDATSCSFSPTSLSCFNPRVLAGGRDGYTCEYDRKKDVSIRASSREDATGRIQRKTKHFRFQSARPRGRTRPVAFGLTAAPLWFQSARPRGRTRLQRKFGCGQGDCFNPRVLAGGRDIRVALASLQYRFQSARPRGRTRLLV